MQEVTRSKYAIRRLCEMYINRSIGGVQHTPPEWDPNRTEAHQPIVCPCTLDTSRRSNSLQKVSSLNMSVKMMTPSEHDEVSVPDRNCLLKPVKVRSTYTLVVYATVVSVALVAAAAFGAVFYQKSLTPCGAEGSHEGQDTRVYTSAAKQYLTLNVEGHHVTEDSQADDNRDIRVIKSRQDGETQSSITVLDFKKSLTAMYLPETGECYLVAGLDTSIPSPQEEEKAPAGSDQDSSPVDLVDWVRTDSRPVSDLALLPLELRPVCADKPTYWLQKNGTDGGKQDAVAPSRSRRSPGTCCVYVCHQGRYGRICGRVCRRC